MNEGERRKWAVFAVLLLMLCAGIGVVALAGSGDEEGPRLTLERFNPPGGRPPELIVSVTREVNLPATATAGTTVGLRCQDRRGRTVLRAAVAWPFIEEPGYGLPHLHQQGARAELDRVATCRLTGTTVELKGRMGRSG